jgi:hypothetical protein
LTDDNNRFSTVTVHGTDFRINEPTDFSTKWFSHKFKGPGLRYEVAISIMGGGIVHIQGPNPCGKWPDIKNFRECLIYKLREGGKVEADNGYRGEPEKIRTPLARAYYFSEEKKQKYKARARHETCASNRRFKHGGVPSQRFRHELTDHRKICGSIVVITQIELRNGHPLFQVEYD